MTGIPVEQRQINTARRLTYTIPPKAPGRPPKARLAVGRRSRDQRQNSGKEVAQTAARMKQELDHANYDKSELQKNLTDKLNEIAKATYLTKDL